MRKKGKTFTRREMAELFVEFRNAWGRWPSRQDIIRLNVLDRLKWPAVDRISERGGIPHIIKIAEEIMASGKSAILGE